MRVIFWQKRLFDRLAVFLPDGKICRMKRWVILNVFSGEDVFDKKRRSLVAVKTSKDVDHEAEVVDSE